MFTGIIEEIGIVKKIIKGTNAATITIKANDILNDVSTGDSICTNGVCLTVTDFIDDLFTVDVMPETMKISNLNYLKQESEVNLERALTIDKRLGGHIVSGHIDGLGIIKDIKKDDNAYWITIACGHDILKYIIYKGSIAIDGVSLTVAYVDNFQFKVCIIPHTGKQTTLLKKKVEDKVNLECDIIGKYLEKFININQKESKQSIDFNLLKENGFM